MLLLSAVVLLVLAFVLFMLTGFAGGSPVPQVPPVRPLWAFGLAACALAALLLIAPGLTHP
jgi:hypothetical protein